MRLPAQYKCVGTHLIIHQAVVVSGQGQRQKLATQLAEFGEVALSAGVKWIVMISVFFRRSIRGFTCLHLSMYIYNTLCLAIVNMSFHGDSMPEVASRLFLSWLFACMVVCFVLPL